MDTIGLILKKESAPNTAFLEAIPGYLTNIKFDGLSYDQRTITGTLKGLEVSINENSVKVRKASLQKYYMGNNIETFTRLQIKEAFGQLSDELHLPLNKAEVKKFHFAKNIILKYDVGLYLPYLRDLKGFKRCEQPSGIVYKQPNKSFCIYDKIKEVKAHRDPLPPLYRNCHMIRLESRYDRKVPDAFNRSIVTPETLTDEKFFCLINDDFYNLYTKIQKERKTKIDMNNVKTREHLKAMAMIQFIENNGGKSKVLQDLAERYQMGLLSKKQAFDQKQYIIKCSNLKTQTVESELIIELDKAVKQSI